MKVADVGIALDDFLGHDKVFFGQEFFRDLRHLGYSRIWAFTGNDYLFNQFRNDLRRRGLCFGSFLLIEEEQEQRTQNGYCSENDE